MRNKPTRVTKRTTPKASRHADFFARLDAALLYATAMGRADGPYIDIAIARRCGEAFLGEQAQSLNERDIEKEQRERRIADRGRSRAIGRELRRRLSHVLEEPIPADMMQLLHELDQEFSGQSEGGDSNGKRVIIARTAQRRTRGRIERQI